MQDLEIYIRDLPSGAISQWLSSHLDKLEFDDSQVLSVVKGSALYEGRRLNIALHPGAFGKRFASLNIEGEQLPWNTDLDCARSAWRSIDTEIRCSPGDWKEGEPVEEDKWWRLDQRGEQQVVWN